MPPEHDIIDPPADNTAVRDTPVMRTAGICFAAWVLAVLGVYFLAFGSRMIVSLLGRLGMKAAGDAFQWLHDALMTWFSAPGGA